MPEVNIHEINKIVQEVYMEYQNTVKGNDLHELHLFRALENSIKRYGGDCIIIRETHGRKAQVKFYSTTHAQDAQCEIADWLIVVVSKSIKAYRATFWQAKYDRSNGKMSLSNQQGMGVYKFKAQFNQWELLSQRPKIQGVSPFLPPENLLLSAPSPSIGSYGIFYKYEKRIELAYSVADMLIPTPIRKNSPSKPKSHKDFCLNGKLEGIQGYWSQDTLVAIDLRGFLVSLLSFNIGALFLLDELPIKRLKYIRYKINSIISDIRQYNIDDETFLQIRKLYSHLYNCCTQSNESCYKYIYDIYTLLNAWKKGRYDPHVAHSVLREMYLALESCLRAQSPDRYPASWLQEYLERKIGHPLFGDGNETNVSDGNEFNNGNDGGWGDRDTSRGNDGDGLNVMVIWLD